jgi:uncharacterized membrane protein YdcZ (DUF606 family)
MMEESLISPLARWENFYVIVGSSAGALTGLQFVVMALIAESQRASMLEIRAFGTPTVVHFCASLLIAAIASAPWDTLWGASVALNLCGITGVVYILLVIRHARRQTGYKPDLADWMWYTGLPLLGYLTLAVSSKTLINHSRTSLFVIATVSLLLLFIGIHNSWDSVTYITISRITSANKSREQQGERDRD